MQANRLDELSRRRLAMLREAGGTFKAASPWVAVYADRIAKTASKLVGGEPEEWLECAFAALGRPSRFDVCIAAIREVADEVEAEQESDHRQHPDRDAEPDRRQQAGRAARVTIGRKRGKR
jgi:sugar (pentulose or hexulose) kinase